MAARAVAYHSLGRSGLRVSRLALGAMTFGQKDWGCDEGTSREILKMYLERGGNFIDTANVYGDGNSESLLGVFLEELKTREKLVLATKFTFGSAKGDPNVSGNGRKSMMHSVERSLRRLRTDYIDLLLVHAWDHITPAEKVMRGLDDLVRQGKVLHTALSDVPAWYAARAQTLAEWRGYAPLCALQLAYSLSERTIEFEYTDLCRELGMGLIVWSPLSGGVLSGKYMSTAADAEPGRMNKMPQSIAGEGFKVSERRQQILLALSSVAEKLGRSMAQIAINWVANRPLVGSVILGANTTRQLEDNMGSLDFEIPSELLAELDRASAPAKMFPYSVLEQTRAWINPESTAKWPGYAG